ncbi:DoxX family protein [Streptomyces sp. MTZ3.1]|uniref:DoxX family protein n=2 Tax=Streptomyces meridianus TaxID=2938945 RepID=A0ABT0X3Z9_9ACTN|nr:DoxX family protein [Streptomyces meridianus]MCM2577269.1 DoxX family protein [Streptomyces meridianus]
MGGRSPGFDDEPLLSTVKVPCDPAQVIVNHASFRVQLATPVVRHGLTADAAGHPKVAPQRRRTPVVWSGRTEPGDPAAGQLLQAVRNSGASLGLPDDPTATRVLPRIPDAGTPRTPGPGTGMLRGARPVRGAFDEDAADGGSGPYRDRDARGRRRPVGAYDDAAVGAAYVADDEPLGEDDGFGAGGLPADAAGPRARRRPGDDSVRHAYYPGRRMNLGVVLLPLRIFLGFISVYAGMGKLCDPVYFDGGESGTMVTWLAALRPWGLASSLRDFALAHPVGSGLTVAFLQIVVGVLTILGLWQRVAASLGALLSAALLLTVSWRSAPAYDVPDIVYLAAWSPLVIAGAPVYSMDGRLTGEAWRRLGPRSGIWDLRKRVLRRGTVLVTVVVGLALLTGSMLGGAVRSTRTATVPEPGGTPTNHLPGSPLPKEPSRGPESQVPGAGNTGRSAQPSSPASPSETARGNGRVGDGTGRDSSSTTPTRPVPPPAPPTGPTGGTSGGSAPGGGSSSGGTGGSGSSGGGSDSGDALGGLLG